MLRNYWYIACAANQLQAAPRAIKILDQDIVVFRDSSGQPCALLDRCCHRGTQLSLGEVVEGSLACRYHGWRYDGTGTCVHIPSLTSTRRIPAGCHVPTFPCLEQDSYIWIWLGTAEQEQEPTYQPSIPEYTQHAAWEQSTKDWHCSTLRAIENNLDWCHPAFAHPGTHPYYMFVQEYGFNEYAYEMRLLANGLVVFAPPTASEQEPLPDQAFVRLRFELPDRVTVQLPEDNITVMHFVPTGDSTCRLECLVHYDTLTDEGVSWTDEEYEVFVQDRRILESAQQWYDRAGSDFERSVEADAPTLLVRRIVELAARGEWKHASSRLLSRRLGHAQR